MYHYNMVTVEVGIYLTPFFKLCHYDITYNFRYKISTNNNLHPNCKTINLGLPMVYLIITLNWTVISRIIFEFADMILSILNFFVL